ncbi:MAG: DNA mismatch repair protein MutS [Blastocatellia bacterium]
MTTPLRRQYLDIKRRYPGMILLFQIGDFYETFDEDAHVLARELGVALTRKWFGKGQVHPLAGIPTRSLESHLAKLIQRGHKIAICDQVTPPGKGLVQRGVTRIITPGTLIEPGLLEGRNNNFLASYITPHGNETVAASGARAGIAWADVSTGEFAAAELDREQALAELERLGAAELIIPREMTPPAIDVRSLTRVAVEQTQAGPARKALLEHFAAKTLAPFGLEQQPLAVRAAGAILAYLRDTQPDALQNLTRLQQLATENFMRIDPQTVRNLEIFQSWDFTGGAPIGSLVAGIDLTLTPMGGRWLRKWLRHPLLDLTEIRARQDTIEWFVKQPQAREKLREALASVLDVERLLGRIRRRAAVPAEISALAHSLRQLPHIRAALEKRTGKSRPPTEFTAPLEQCQDLVEYIDRAIMDRAPADFDRGGIIREGFSPELDELRGRLTGGKDFLAKFEARERARTGIKSLRVGYNKVFGYYIEITKPNLRLAPRDYIRKQTLTNAERFFTMELKEHESLIANAKERLQELEQSLYRQICDELSRHHQRIGRVATGVARLDLYAAFAEMAARHHYVRPELNDSAELMINGGRHPMIELRLTGESDPSTHETAPGRSFVANDTALSADATRIMLLTAPNMAGKSVYLRQVALIVLLAQTGSFVPATSARIGLVDRIFTRIGLTDYTLQGHSSFMVEMIETARILNQATPRSLILLDEVGRGTSTADGLSIARAVIEYLHNHPAVRAKTLFATHYHELTDAPEYLPHVKNFHLAVEEIAGNVRYLHCVKPGKAEKSFGIHVAQLAGLPKPVINRATELLQKHSLEKNRDDNGHQSIPSADHDPTCKQVADQLRRLDLNNISPVEALTRLYEFQCQLTAKIIKQP